MIPSSFPLETFRKYSGLALPRHVSYPMPTAWSEHDGEDFFSALAQREDADASRGISLYIHIPFCESLCKFCACNRIILKKGLKDNESRKDHYLAALHAELEMLAGKKGMRRPIRQIHWGGGSPTYLEGAEIDAIQQKIYSLFNMAPDAEIAMEIDPRRVPFEKLESLKKSGFNRLSMGIQDFTPEVQSHVNRIQPIELIEEVVANIRNLEIGQINFDLIYGMPFQTGETVRDMIHKTLRLRPDRIAFYHYAQIPEKIATQRGMDYEKLPNSEEKLAMFLEAIDLFNEGGYEFIGLDHFALPEDALTVAHRNGTIQRNFQGMTTHRGLDLIGVGAFSISHLLGLGFWQKLKDESQYADAILAGTLPIERGLHFSPDDRVRQDLLSNLYCYGRVDLHEVSKPYGLDAMSYFAKEWEDLHELEADGLVSLVKEGVFEVTLPLGRALLRNIGAVFDAYLDPDAYKHGDRYYYSVSA